MSRQQIKDYNYAVQCISNRDHEIGMACSALWAVLVSWSMYAFALHVPYLQNNDGYTGLFSIMTIVTAILTSMALYPFVRLAVPLIAIRLLQIPEPPATCVKCQNQV